jgi:hypothetical protein
MGRLSKSELVKKLALKSFKECDLDNDGALVWCSLWASENSITTALSC